MANKKLSVVIATYNGEKFLREQLDSLYAQTLLPDEVIAIDDCSKDGTIGILEEYQAKYGLKYIINDNNLGVNGNFNKGIMSCTGDYISLCDQDDVWFQNKNETLYKKIQKLESLYGTDQPCCVSSRNTFVDENLNVHHSTELLSDTDDFRDTIIHHLSQGSSMMFNRACLKYILPLPGYDEGICYDTYIGYIVAMVGHKYDLKESLMYYRVHGNNVTASLDVPKFRSNLKRKRETTVVPMHMIRTFRYAVPIAGRFAAKDRLDYVKNIISLSQNINILKRMYILLTTPHIPFGKKMYSFKAALLNFFFRLK